MDDVEIHAFDSDSTNITDYVTLPRILNDAWTLNDIDYTHIINPFAIELSYTGSGDEIDDGHGSFSLFTYGPLNPHSSSHLFFIGASMSHDGQINFYVHRSSNQERYSLNVHCPKLFDPFSSKLTMLRFERTHNALKFLVDGQICGTRIWEDGITTHVTMTSPHGLILGANEQFGDYSDYFTTVKISSVNFTTGRNHVCLCFF